MAGLLSTYLAPLLRPVGTQRLLRAGRARAPSLVEALAVSWLFATAEAACGLLILALREDGPGAPASAWVLAWPVVFPPALLLCAGFWKTVIRTTAGGLLPAEDLRRASSEVVHSAASSHALRLVPVLGGPLQHLAALAVLFVGLRENLGLSPARSLATVLLPFLVLGAAAVLALALAAALALSALG